MSSGAPWTIERISDALGTPDLVQRFLGEINTAQADRLLAVFTKWADIAGDLEEAFDPNDPDVAAAHRGEEPPGEWIDITGEVKEEAARIRSRGAA